MLSAVRQIIRENRRGAPFRLAAQACEKYLRAWYNEGFYDFRRNGESFALTQFSKWMKRPAVIWDIGAHNGEWSEAAHGILPDAHVHSFEIIPAICARMKEEPWRTVYNFGLSDKAAKVEVHLNHAHDSTNSICPRSESQWFASGTELVSCRVVKGDELCSTITKPDLLKIDVEGHEAAVIRGFAQTLLGHDLPCMIQIEYGETYVPHGATLKEIYSLLNGYSLGRLYPNYVEFKAYSYEDENYRMGNMIAVRDPGLQKLLSFGS